MIFLKRGDLMGKRPPQFLWLEVTKDEYEFPIYIADTAEELAKLTKVGWEKIYFALCKLKDYNDSAQKTPPVRKNARGSIT